MRLYYFITQFLLFISIASFGSDKDSSEINSKYFSIGYSLNIIDMLPAQISVGFKLSDLLKVKLLYGHLLLTNNSINKQITYFETISGTESASMTASTSITTSNYLKLTVLKSITVNNKSSHAEIGLFYSFSRTRQDLSLLWQQDFYGIYKDVYTRDYYYHNIGLTVMGYYKISKQYYFVYGSEIFIPINVPKVFDDVISNYYKGAAYTPGQGFGVPFIYGFRVPISFNIGIEYRIPFRN